MEIVSEDFHQWEALEVVALETRVEVETLLQILEARMIYSKCSCLELEVDNQLQEEWEDFNLSFHNLEEVSQTSINLIWEIPDLNKEGSELFYYSF